VSGHAYAGSGDELHGKLAHDGKTSKWMALGKDWKSDETRKVYVEGDDVGCFSSSKPCLLELQAGGTDGLLLSSVTVRIGSSSRDVQSNTIEFSPKGEYVMCRSSGAGISNCILTLQNANEFKWVGSTCDLPEHPRVPTALTSNFKSAQPGSELKYNGFQVWMDCTKNAAYRFEYMAYKDCHNFARSSGFRLDPNFDKGCQQTNGLAYPKTDGIAFDRGHLVPANHMDGDALAIRQSNYMTNILPQAAKMNRGAWLETEELIECWRDVEPLHVVGGAMWPSSSDSTYYPRRNWFKDSHNVENPSFFWKVVTGSTIFSDDNHRIAFLMPNSEHAARGTLDQFVVSIAELEAALKQHGQAQTFSVPQSRKSAKPRQAWRLPPNCDKSRR